jgi:hypothetical protein
MEKVIKAYRNGIISRDEAVECLQRKHGLTLEESVALVGAVDVD